MKKLSFAIAMVTVGGQLLAGGVNTGDFINEFTLPLLEKAPVLDGAFSPDEWRGCAGFDGLTQATGNRAGKLDERSGRTYVGATVDALYIALVTELPDGGGKLVTDTKDDIFKVVFDDSFEIWIDPDPANAKANVFQSLFNSLGKGVYTVHPRGGAAEQPGWNGRFEIKNGFTSDRWVTEIRIPLEHIAQGRKSTDGVWGIGVCRNWKQPWSQTSAPGSFRGRNTRFTFTASPGAVVALEQLKDPFTRDLETKLIVHNPAPEERIVKARLELERNTMFKLEKSQELKIAPGGSASLTFAHKEDNSYAFDQLAEVTSADGSVVYYKRSTAWAEPRKKRWDTVVEKKLPVDFSFGYYPYKNKLRIDADISGLPKDAKVDELTINVGRQWSSEIIASTTLKDFSAKGKQEVSLALPDLSDGIYEISALAKGQNVPGHALVKTFVRRHYPWEKNPMGRSTKVYPPFTPIEVAGKTLKTVLRTHQLNDLGLLDQVNAAGQNMLSAPMTFTAKVDGKEVAVSASPLAFTSAQGNEVVTASRIRAGALDASATGVWDYDGTLKYQLTLNSSGGKTLDELTLDIPLDDARAPLIHALSQGIRKGPICEPIAAGQGVVWDARRLILGELPAGFCSYIFLGNGHRGLSWFAENDKNWSWDRKTPNLELVRDGKKLTLRIHLVNQPLVVTSPQTITFGLLAAPVKPQLWKNHRTYWSDKKINPLLTDINWLAGPGSCNNVYPVGRDPFFWRILARSSQEKLTKDEIDDAVARGTPYFEPFGEDDVARWTRTAYANLGGRHIGRQMLFYYNRAQSICSEEYATFLDEWMLKEMPGHDYKLVNWENKLVPSESYIDFALYWYKKSFEYGRNTGVYWDNWYLEPTYNLEMTDAYRGADGEIVPSTGLWGLRELCKRTFIMLNEEGMEPRTFPHMTSASVLPILAFATMQLDWEWKAGEGDTQDRFSREYLQVGTSGELAGLVSIPLWNHGFKSDDLLGLRSYTGVQMLHDVTFYDITRNAKKYPAWVDGFVEGLMQHLHKPEVKTWRYWDEVAQPVSTGDVDLPVIVHSVPGDETWVVLCAYADADRPATLTIDPKPLGLSPGYTVTNVETDEDCPVKDNTVHLNVKRHEVIGLRIKVTAK